MLIDSHCHLHDPEFFSEEEATAALVRARESGVEKIICIGTSHEDSLVAKEFAKKHEGVYWTYGVHPSEAGRVAEKVFSRDNFRLDRSETYIPDATEKVARRATFPGSPVYDVDCPLGRNREAVDGLAGPEKDVSDRTRPIAIGEVGLDYHYEDYDRHEQIRLFEEMLQLAMEADLPVSFHVREAFDDFFAVVANFPKINGVVHSFSDNKKNLKRILNGTEFYIGVNGMATYSTLPTPPIERILFETDAPFLAPVPHRGEKNEPAYVLDVAKWLGLKLDLSVEKIAKITTENCEKLFKI